MPLQAFHPSPTARRLRTAFAVLSGFIAFNAWAQTTSTATPVLAGSLAVGKPVSLHGRTTQKQPFDLAKLRGKMVLLFFWSTDCAVCLDKLPELRRNLAGWRGKQFVIVAVNQDRHQSDLVAYEKVLMHIVPGNADLDKQMQILWRKDPAYQDNLGSFPVRSSTSLLINREGKLVNSIRGHIPNEVWDDIAAELISK
jgi:thiol-disulfide isomerase/thioredoxin